MKKPRQITIILDGEEKQIRIKELPIIKYATVLNQLKEIPKLLVGFDTKSPADIIAVLPQLLSVALPEVLEIIVLGLEEQVTRAELETLGLSSIVDICIDIFEVNDYQEIFEKLKKALARQTPKAVKTINPS